MLFRSSGATYDIELKDVNSSNLDGRRLTPLQALESVAANKSDAHSAAGRSGISSQSLVQRDEMAVLLFRNFQARRLAGGK